MLISNSKSLGNRVVSPKEERKGCSGNDLQKRKENYSPSLQCSRGAHPNPLGFHTAAAAADRTRSDQ